MSQELAPKNTRARRPFMVLLSVFLAMFPRKGLELSSRQYTLVTKVFNGVYREEFIGYILPKAGNNFKMIATDWAKDNDGNVMKMRKINMPEVLANDKEVIQWCLTAWPKIKDGERVIPINKAIKWKK